MMGMIGSLPAKEPDAEKSLGDDPVAAKSIDFGADVRPILSDHCFACHGPDEADRQADVRLDTQAGLEDVVVAKDVEASLLVERILESDPDLLMPPPEYHKPLSAEQRSTLIAWIRSGAEFQNHWAFEPISVKPPKTSQATRDDGVASSGPSSTIDRYLDAQISAARLTSNGTADRYALIRRATLDLTGLPPSIEEVDAFISDESPNAYENLVDRLLETPAYGEHMARYWLDLVRFADTHGLHLDNYREMWPYRDWVVSAFNQNLPFDQFITEQLAGDLMPEPTRDQLIASGFNRLNVTTNEGGSIYEEVFARNVIDRTDAFGTIFLGLTTGCAVCHDHKFDPISSEDYYSLSAFFNSLDGSALDKNDKAPAPVITITTSEQDQQLAEMNQELNRVRASMRGDLPSVDQAQLKWERAVVERSPPESHDLQPTDVHAKSGKSWEVLGDGSIRLSGKPAATDEVIVTAKTPAGQVWQTLTLHAIADPKTERVGASPNGNAVLSEIVVEISADGSEWLPVGVRNGIAEVEQANGNFSVDYAFDGKTDDKAAGWAVGGHQSTGDRRAWFSLQPIDAIDEPIRIRVTLKFLSQFPQHQFGHFSLSLSDGTPEVPVDQQVQLGPVHSIGPFVTESPN
ncbi:MAG: DUF1549 domain-containing protein, partial [Planctomycetota bacterium]